MKFEEARGLVYYDRTSESFITAAFLFPHVNDKRDLPSTELLDYLVTVDEIEAITGLDFLHELSTADQDKTESKKNFDFWESKLK